MASSQKQDATADDRWRPLRIGFATPEYVSEDNYSGGLANYLYRVCQALKMLGHEPMVIVASTHRGRIEHDGIPVYRVNAHRCGWRAALQARITRHRKKFSEASYWLLQSHAMRSALRSLHQATPFSLIQYASYTGIGFFRLREVPAVGRISSLQHLWDTANGIQVTSNKARKRSWIEKRALLGMDAVFGPSDLINTHAQDWLRRSIKTIESPFVPWRGEVDDHIYQELLSGKRYVLYFGALNRLKGADRLADLIYPLLESDNNLHFVMVTKHPPTASAEKFFIDIIKKAAGEHAGRLLKLGPLKRPSLDPIIAHATAVVLPSRIDNLPNTCIESMAAGRVVVAMRDASFDQLIDDQRSGFLCPQDDSEALLRTVKQALSLSEDKRNTIGKIARERVTQLAPELIVRTLEQYYCDVLMRHAG